MSAALALSPAHLSQRRFRALMDAFARPGTVHTLGEDLAPKGAMPQAAMAGLLGWRILKPPLSVTLPRRRYGTRLGYPF